MDTLHFKYNFSDLQIRFADIEPLLVNGNAALHEPYPEYIHEILGKGNSLFSIEGGLVFYDNIKIKVKEHNIIVNNIVLSAGKIVSSQLKNSQMLAFFVCTAGNKIETLSKKYFTEGDFPKGFVADIIGSVAVETAMDRIQSELKDKMREKGLVITNRYSPGYCGWKVSEQQILFSLLPHNFCNISLSKHSLMSPIKSVSGIIGIGKNVRFNDYTCRICDVKDCIFRNRKHSKVVSNN